MSPELKQALEELDQAIDRLSSSIDAKSAAHAAVARKLGEGFSLSDTERKSVAKRLDDAIDRIEAVLEEVA
jgi:hypothetical protein